MACDLKFKKAKFNSKDYLESVRAIDNSLKIIDINAFRKHNELLSQSAETRYQVTGELWLEEDTKGGTRAVPNDAVLDAIDQRRKELGLYEKQVSADIDLIEDTTEEVVDIQEVLEESKLSTEGLESESILKESMLDRKAEEEIAKQNEDLTALSLMNFNEVFPQYKDKSDDDKLTLIYLVEKGFLELSC